MTGACEEMEQDFGVNLIPSSRGKFLAIPNSKAPRVVLPFALRLRRSVMQLYTPQRPVGRIVVWLARMGFSIGERVELLEEPEIRGTLGKIVGKEVSIALWVAPPGAYQKLTVQLIGNDGTILAYAKFAQKPLAIKSLEREYHTLKLLEGQSQIKDQIPKVIAWIPWRSGFVLLLTPGPSLPGPNKFGRHHEQFLESLQSITFQKMPFEESPMWLDIKALFAELVSHLSSEWVKRYQRALHLIINHLGQETLGFTMIHGDFTPWNTRRSKGGKLFVFDWEFARAGYLASYDRFHFSFMQAVLTRMEQPPRPVPGSLQWWEYLAYVTHISLMYHHFLFARGGREDDAVLTGCARELDALVG